MDVKIVENELDNEKVIPIFKMDEYFSSDQLGMIQIALEELDNKTTVGKKALEKIKKERKKVEMIIHQSKPFDDYE